jgi:hypothetical protein
MGCFLLLQQGTALDTRRLCGTVTRHTQCRGLQGLPKPRRCRADGKAGTCSSMLMAACVAAAVPRRASAAMVASPGNINSARSTHKPCKHCRRRPCGLASQRRPAACCAAHVRTLGGILARASRLPCALCSRVKEGELGACCHLWLPPTEDVPRFSRVKPGQCCELCAHPPTMYAAKHTQTGSPWRC